MTNNLEELRKTWNGKLEVVTEFGSDKNSTFVVVLKDLKATKNEYTVHRYFVIGNQWAVSCDAYDVSADEAFAVASRGIKIELDTVIALERALEQKAAQS